MNIPFKTIFMACVCSGLLALGGCGAISSSDDPELNEFEIIDTSGSDSASAPQSEISVDPDENTTNTEEGEFTLYWDVNTDDNYYLYIWVNDKDQISGATELYSNYCDPDDDCHDDQSLQCDFQNDLDIVCEDFDDNESTINIEDIINANDLPEDLYFILEVCDPYGFDCEDQSIRVEFRD